jgi:hypothetical protein
MTKQRSKKSETLEVRLSYEAKQAFMRKAASENRSASEIVRGLLCRYVDEPARRQFVKHRRWKAAAVAGAAMLLVGTVSWPLTQNGRAATQFSAASDRRALLDRLKHGAGRVDSQQLRALANELVRLHAAKDEAFVRIVAVRAKSP